MMYLALTYDHRILDGREAVTFLVKVRRRAKSQFLGLFTDPFHRSKSTSRTLAACFSAKQADLGIVVHNRLHGLKYGTLTSRYFYSVASGFFSLLSFFLIICRLSVYPCKIYISHFEFNSCHVPTLSIFNGSSTPQMIVQHVFLTLAS